MKKNICKKINDLMNIEFHQNIAKRQRYVYNLDRTDKSRFSNTIMIEMDFKQKVVIGNKNHFLFLNLLK